MRVLQWPRCAAQHQYVRKTRLDISLSSLVQRRPLSKLTGSSGYLQFLCHGRHKRTLAKAGNQKPRATVRTSHLPVGKQIASRPTPASKNIIIPFSLSLLKELKLLENKIQKHRSLANNFHFCPPNKLALVGTRVRLQLVNMGENDREKPTYINILMHYLVHKLHARVLLLFYHALFLISTCLMSHSFSDFLPCLSCFISVLAPQAHVPHWEGCCSDVPLR